MTRVSFILKSSLPEASFIVRCRRIYQSLLAADLIAQKRVDVITDEPIDPAMPGFIPIEQYRQGHEPSNELGRFEVFHVFQDVEKHP